MAEDKDKDNLADALDALARGERAPSGTGSEELVDLSPKRKPGRPAVPGSVPPPPMQPSARSAQRPPTPPLFRSPSLVKPPAPPAPSADGARPPAPATPPRPAARPAPAKPPAPRPPRPDRPAAPAARVVPDAPEETVAPMVVNGSIPDDDRLDLPAPTPDMLAHLPAPAEHHLSAAAVAAVVVPHGLGFRRTIIPVLLTCGVLLLVTAAVRWLGGDDSPFVALPAWVAAALAGAGVAFLAVAVLNVFQVREELARIAAATGPNPPAPAPAG
jgi:hypothetical protein